MKVSICNAQKAQVASKWEREKTLRHQLLHRTIHQNNIESLEGVFLYFFSLFFSFWLRDAFSKTQKSFYRNDSLTMQHPELCIEYFSKWNSKFTLMKCNKYIAYIVLHFHGIREFLFCCIKKHSNIGCDTTREHTTIFVDVAFSCSGVLRRLLLCFVFLE